VYMLHTYSDTLLGMFENKQAPEVHVHAGFLLYVQGEKIDLTSTQYQSSTEQVLHPSMHFHDNIDTMLHRHANKVTLGEFLNSLNITLTTDCLTLDTGLQYCTDGTNKLTLLVNGDEVRSPEAYIVQEEDRVLLYYGTRNSTELEILAASVSDEACMYSGNCPERGEPPFESCGLTCEI
jgi:hypothetical protein